MAQPTFQQALDAGECFLFDGSTATALHDRGITLQRSFEECNLKAPDLLLAIHGEFLSAGAQVLTTNTWGAGRLKLAARGLDGQLDAINREGVALAKQAITQQGTRAWVAGCIGPLGVRIEPWGPTSFDEARALYIRATQDQLTGLGNRALFNDRLHQFLALARRAKEHLGLVVLDMDGLKQINDTHGHQAGDEALRTLGQRLQSATRATDVSARLGGDEFALILPAVEDDEAARRAVARIAEQLRGPFTYAGVQFSLEVSLGLAVFPNDGKDDEALIAFADQSMYEAKRARKAHG